MTKVTDRKVGGLYIHSDAAYLCLQTSNAFGKYKASFIHMRPKDIVQTWWGWHSLRPAKSFKFGRIQERKIVKFLFGKEIEW